MAAVQATFKLGIRSRTGATSARTTSTRSALDRQGPLGGGLPALLAEGPRKRGISREYGEYCKEWVAAKRNRFAVLPNMGLNYAYHIDASLYAQFLRKISRGARRAGSRARSVRSTRIRRAASSPRSSWTPACGRRRPVHRLHRLPRPADRADAEGGYEDWTHWLPCTARWRADGVGRSAASLHALDRPRSGLAVAHPAAAPGGQRPRLQPRHWSDQQAIDKLLATSKASRSPSRACSASARPRRRHWHLNCVAVGLASRLHRAAGVDQHPPDPAQHHPADADVPLRRHPPADVDEFNRQMSFEIEHVRDFIILHYHVTERSDTPFWRQCRSMQIPDSLRTASSCSGRRGACSRSTELFGENSWIQVMLGQGHPAGAVPPDRQHDGRRGTRALPGRHPRFGQAAGGPAAGAPAFHRSLLQACGT
jgi:tryptophan 7-halogenase